MEPATTLPLLLGLAWLVPLASFVLILLAGPRLGKAGVLGGYVATGAILVSLGLSLTALGCWISHPAPPTVDHTAAERESAEPTGGEPASQEHAAVPPRYFANDWYTFGSFGSLKMTIGYHIDALTVCMFVMVSLIATCIHFYSLGYMHEELHEVADHEVVVAGGGYLHRRGRFHRFFQYMSLFCFSMFGLVLAGNLAMVFVFWELVGICSYFLIGFYRERKSASNAANKAFIVNRVGDFGMLIGIMALWGSLGTLTFGGERGIFRQVRSVQNDYRLAAPDGMVKEAAVAEIAAGVQPTRPQIDAWRAKGYGYGLLVVAGLGIFCGCVGKSAQFPLHVWLPDAMEGPTPVSALIHAATMVAAGVYLVGRFYPVFTPEVLLVIAYVGGITLLIAATIAITATDIKRVLAYSTVSQLGYMMLALGIGGWLAGLFHLFTHAFFKSLLFLCSGSVIHACHTNEMPRMGGLRKKMPWTAYTMLVGCLAIVGGGLPFAIADLQIGLSGYYSKDSIIAQALSFKGTHAIHGPILFYTAVGGAAITAFYMFRLWYLTFAGAPRDLHVHEHAHESPRIMYVPLVILAVCAIVVGWHVPFTDLSLTSLLEQARPIGGPAAGFYWPQVRVPEEHLSHTLHGAATWYAFAMTLLGFSVATALYGLRLLDPEQIRRRVNPLYRFLLRKWWFDELYWAVFVRPAHAISRLAAAVDKRGLDGIIDGLALATRGVAKLDDLIDRYFVDKIVNLLADWTYALGLSLRNVQTGMVRQYVMLIAVGTVVLFVLIGFALELGVPNFLILGNG
ncbi:MAG: NADH-quinone oxidoreductase subunit L [Pirellulales bacterium]